jgi:hypothetical protein
MSATSSTVAAAPRVKRKKAMVYFKRGPKRKMLLDEGDNVLRYSWKYKIGTKIQMTSATAEKNMPSYATREKRILLEWSSPLKIFERGTVSCCGRSDSIVSVYAVGNYAGDNNCVWVEEAIISEVTTMTVVPFSHCIDSFEGLTVTVISSHFPCTIRITHRGSINTKVVHSDDPKATFNFYGESGVPPVIVQATDSADGECSCTLYPGEPHTVRIKRQSSAERENAIALTSSSDEEEEEDKPRPSPESKKREKETLDTNPVEMLSMPAKTAKIDLKEELSRGSYGCMWDSALNAFVWHLYQGKKCQNMPPHIHSDYELVSVLRSKVRDEIQSASTGDWLLLWDCIKQKDVWNFVENEEEFDIPEDEEPPPTPFLMARAWDAKENAFVWHEDEGETCKQMPPHEHDQFQPNTELDKIKRSLGYMETSQWWYSWEKDLYQVNIDARYVTKLRHHHSAHPHKTEQKETTESKHWKIIQTALAREALPPQPPSVLPSPNIPPALDVSQASTNFDCIVCMERKRSVVFFPCKHLVVCEECIKVLRKENDYLCPICRSQVTGHVKVFV